MSELIDNTAKRLEKLYQFTHRLVDGENGSMLIKQYREYFETVTATETMQVFDRLLQNGYPVEKVKSYAGKIINVFYQSLNSLVWDKPGEGHFLLYLMQENGRVKEIMANLKNLIKEIHKTGLQKGSSNHHQLGSFVNQLKEYELHYIKKENILFPYVEKTFPEYGCLKIMWSFHDDFRKSLRELEILLGDENPDKEKLNIALGNLFFVVIPIIFREEQIVYPVAIRAINSAYWNEMLEQSFEAGWCYGVKPQKKQNQKKPEATLEGKINLDTGFLNPAQLILLFENLPVDITFVDENDEVCYFSGAKHRIFPRSKAIIGRKVQNCHPPESVHIVNEIVEAFRNGSRDHADFWIQMKGRFIHIRYFALRNENGEYKGTIELSQDVTEIRALQGEQRLLDWK
jgi:PAS domain S-box-containing protein